MSRFRGNAERCPGCSVRYQDFRCSFRSAQEVLDAMWFASTDKAKWRYKGKSGVLGYWHQVKQLEWQWHLATCRPSQGPYRYAESDFLEY